MKKLSTALFISALALPSVALAATDGTLGATSSGTLSLQAEVIEIVQPQSEVQISGLQDIDFGNILEGATGSAQTINSICIYLSTASTFSLTITSTNTFSLNNGAGLGFSYSASFTDPDGNSASTGLSGSSSPTCSNADMASLTVTPTGVAPAFDGTPISTANGYTDQITMTVTPE